MVSSTNDAFGLGSNVTAYRPHGQVWISITGGNLPIRYVRTSQVSSLSCKMREGGCLPEE